MWLYLLTLILLVNYSQQQDLCSQTLLDNLSRIMDARLAALEIRMNQMASFLNGFEAKQDTNNIEIMGKLAGMSATLHHINSTIGGVADKEDLSNQEMEVKLDGMSDTLHHMNSSIGNVVTEQNVNNQEMVGILTDMSDTMNNMNLTIRGAEYKQESNNQELVGILTNMSATLIHMDSTIEGVVTKQVANNNSLKEIKNYILALQQLQNTSIERIVDITERLPCRIADGFFIFPGTNECFKSIREKMNWAAADARCKAEGASLRRPKDALALRIFLMKKYGDGQHWVDAKADGQFMTWVGDQEHMSASSPLWWPNHGGYVDTQYCMRYLTDQSHLERNPDHPYAVGGCTSTTYSLHPLCELKME
ncbi:unnamed protein product [Meganyctiphanes norvegica]|uniref:C-type lectin domain-containing protein n=1 Tax=Meganyctiphanes norvegica TaxID=48144 RepID=A0AAV2R7U7_MEGNR